MPISIRLPDLAHWKQQDKCQAACPVFTDAGRYLPLVAEGRDEEAFIIARAPNPFASVCGRVCAAPCEDACRRRTIDAPISIRRSSYYLEDAATEFHVQGLELDWVCVTWDADFRYSPKGWGHYSFCGDRWNKIKKEERKQDLKNAYRVLMTRARQGIVIVVPHGNADDHTRNPLYYDSTFDYLNQIGFAEI